MPQFRSRFGSLWAELRNAFGLIEGLAKETNEAYGRAELLLVHLLEAEFLIVHTVSATRYQARARRHTAQQVTRSAIARGKVCAASIMKFKRSSFEHLYPNRLAATFRQRYRISFYNLGYRIIGSLDSYPLPPADLVNLVIGTKQVAWYQLGGVFAHESIVSFLGRNGVHVNSLRSIYDFGCGCGRLTRYWVSLKDHCEIWGTDYNPDLVNWCDQNLSETAKFKINKATPPLDFEDSKFELVYAYSVFTHTRRDQQMDWLKELARITATNGYVFITTQGPACSRPPGLPATYA